MPTMTTDHRNDLIKNLCKTQQGTDMLFANIQANKQLLGAEENGLTILDFVEIFGSERDIPLPLRAYLNGECLAVTEESKCIRGV